jgi:hypothetical protein
MEVNGEPMTLYDVDTQLAWKHGSEAVHWLLDDMVIQQEAQRLHLVVDDSADLLMLRRLSGQIVQPALYRIAVRHLQANMLLRKLVLREVTDKSRCEFYRQHRQVLIRYDLLGSRSQPTDRHPASLRMGLWTGPAIRKTFGAPALSAVEQVAHRGAQPTMAFPSRRGPLYLHVRRVVSGYAELLPAIDDAIVAERAPVLVQRLERQARVSRPIIEADRSRYPRVAGATTPSLQAIFAEPTAASGKTFALPPSVHQPHGVFTEPTAIPQSSTTPGFLTLPPAAHPASGVFTAPSPAPASP